MLKNMHKTGIKINEETVRDGGWRIKIDPALRLLTRKFYARWRLKFRAAEGITTRIAAVGLAGMAWLISSAPAQADNITYYYYSGTEMSGVVAWDSTIGAAALINGTRIITQ